MKKNNNIGIQEMVQHSKFSIQGMKMLFVLLFVSIGLNSYSQTSPVFAGEDKYVFFDKTVGRVDVKLGKTDTNDDVYYRWEVYSQSDDGSCFIDNELLSNPTVSIFAKGEYVFECTKVSKYGHKKEYVVVNATSRVNILDVKPKLSECFIHGSTLTRDNFEIVTQPSGCEEYVEIKEGTDVLNGNISTVWPFYMHEVKFKALDEDGEYYDSKIICKIPVIDDQKMVYHKNVFYDKGHSVPYDVEENVKLVQEVYGGLNRIHCLSRPDYILPPALYAMVNPGDVGTAAHSTLSAFNLIKTVVDALGVLKVGASFSYDSQFDELGFKLKCDNGEIYPEVYFNGKLKSSFSLGVDAQVPVKFGPIGVYLSGSLGLDFAIEKTDGKPLNPNNTNLRIPMTFTPNLFIAATVALLNPSVLSASAGIQFDFNVESYMDFNSMMKVDEKLCPECWELTENGIDYDTFHVSMWLKSTVTALSFQAVEYKMKICEIHNINQLTF